MGGHQHHASVVMAAMTQGHYIKRSKGLRDVNTNES
jgi:hypothetical protein